MPLKICEQIADQGYSAPYPIFSAEEARAFLRMARDPRERPPLDWIKGHACTSRLFYEISNHPAILHIVKAFLGNDILLWGASVNSHPSGSQHPWHCDIETASASGRTISVWIGLQDVERDSSLSVVPGSQLFGKSLQEMRHLFQKNREETTDEDVLRWADELKAGSRIVQTEIRNGEALFFEGKLWHCTKNLTDQTRWALLLQYATPDTEIRIPDQNHLDWPFQFLPLPKPPCILINGSDEARINRIVPAPAGRNGWLPQLTSRIYPLQMPRSATGSGWNSFPVFHGTTSNLNFLSCHTSVLKQNVTPHPPHTHEDEEILILLSGEADLLLPDRAGGTKLSIKPGEIVYYPNDFHHSLQAVSSEPANYLMLKWSNDSFESNRVLSHSHSTLLNQEHGGENGFCSYSIFEGPTRLLQKLECHVSILTPGAGYEPHCDAHDVVVLVLEGEVETLGQRVKPYGVIFYAAGEEHGMKNPSAQNAKYAVFEFHARPQGLLKGILKTQNSTDQRPFVLKMFDPQCYVRTYRTLVWNLAKARPWRGRPARNP